MKVRLCEKNKGKSKVARRLAEEHPELDVKVKKCIDVCDECAKTGVARVDGKKVVAKEGEDLYEKIVRKIDGK